MFHNGKTSAATVYKIHPLVMSYVTLEDFNGAKVIRTPFLPFKINILASHTLTAAKISIVDTEL